MYRSRFQRRFRKRQKLILNIMKFILFCENPYAFSILAPIRDIIIEKKYNYIWYLSDHIYPRFPYKDEIHTSNITDLSEYKSDVILVPGNEVPYFLRGLKVQIFHGLAGEKKGHFRIRHYFDLYLTQGPFFTKKFNKLSLKHKNFEVIETGWSKLDAYKNNLDMYNAKRDFLKSKYQFEKIILFAPTFSPSLTSAPVLIHEIENLAKNEKYLILIKFHDLMDEKLIVNYQSLAEKNKNIKFIVDHNITPYLVISDLMISDTSSVVFEFLLLDKPVITYKTKNHKNGWENLTDPKSLISSVDSNINEDPYSHQRAEIIADYHPYQDGKSSMRIIESIEKYINKNGVPEKRDLSFFRRYKINKMYR